MDRTQAIEDATDFRIGATIINANTGEEKHFTSPRVEFYTVGRDEKTGLAVSHFRRVHANQFIPSISKAKHYVRENKLRVVAAKDRTDEIHMRMLVAERQKKVVVL